MNRRVLVLYNRSLPLRRERAAIRSHLQMIEASGGPVDVIYYNTIWGEVPRSVYHPVPDAVILHTTLLTLRWHPLFHYKKGALEWLKKLECIKIAQPQDEYDHSEILDEWLYDLGVTHVFSNFGSDCWRILYPIMSERGQFDTAFTGYIDETTAHRIAPSLKPIRERTIDIVYRARHLPYWFGSHGQLKHRIADVFQERAPQFGFACDVSTEEQDTILGDKWFDFLASGRVIIGTESGVSSMDRRGEIKAAIQSILVKNPELTFEEVSAALPEGWDNYSFYAIGPRHFEAVITKTAQVLVEGHYDGVLKAGIHYIPIKPDFSNLDDVLAQLRDTDYLQYLADNTYRDVYLKGKYTYRDAALNLFHAVEAAEILPNVSLRQWECARRRAALESEVRRRINQAQNKIIERLQRYLLPA
jgi:hypothetical protein